MIVVVKTGKSFKGAHAYLSHDKGEKGGPKATTTDRVAWTHTLNLLENEPDEAVREMQKTCFDAPMLKMMSGNRIDGRPCEQPVMTVSLSWATGQQPDQPQMIEAAQSYLKFMGWEGLQVQLYRHDDTEHAHLHVLVNRIHPDTGMAADKAWVKHRSNQWALAYEREQGQILCPARVGKFENGQHVTNSSMSRAEFETWRHISQQAFVADRQEHVAALQSGEWDSLKDAQRDERLAFWQESGRMRRELRTEAVRMVKQEFAPEWASYAKQRDALTLSQREQDKQTRTQIRYFRRHGGGNGEGIKRLEEKQAAQRAELNAALKEARAPINEAQKARLAVVSGLALADLGKERAAEYAQLLAAQRGEKAELRTDQAAGVRRPDLMQRQHDAAGRLAEAGKPMPGQIPERLETGWQEKRPGVANSNTPPAPGIRSAEAARRTAEHGTSPQFPANQNRDQPVRPERSAADRLPNAAREATQPAASFDMADFMNRQRAFGDAMRAEARPAPRGEVTDRKAAKQNEDARPKTDRQAFIEASRAQSRQKEADRGRDDDGGRGRDR